MEIEAIPSLSSSPMEIEALPQASLSSPPPTTTSGEGEESSGSYLPMTLYPLRHSGVGGAPRSSVSRRRRTSSTCDTPARTFSLRRPRTSSLCGSPSDDQRKRGGYKQPRLEPVEKTRMTGELSFLSLPVFLS